MNKIEQKPKVTSTKGRAEGFFRRKGMNLGISAAVLGGSLVGLAGCVKEVQVPGPERTIFVTPIPKLETPTLKPETPVVSKGIGQEAIKKAVRDALKEQQASIPTGKPLTEKDLQRITDEAAEKAVRRLPTQAPVSPNVQPVYPNPNVQAEVLYGDSFDVRLNGAANYEMIDTRTGQVLDYKRFMVQPISYQETGKGFERTLTYTLYPGQASVEEGVTVNGDLGPIVQIRRSSMPTGSQYPNYRGSTTGFPESFSPRILDGAVATLPTFGNAVAHAVNKANMLKVEKGINAIIRVR